MKIKLFFTALLTALIYFACEDSTLSEIGNSILPAGDSIEIFQDTIDVSLKTVKTDSIYAKTINGALGEYYDPTFGTINAGFACQFYPSIGFQNLDSLIGDKIDSIYLDIYYSYMGDSLTPMELTVYPINKSLEKNYYTSVDPEQFADMSQPLSKYVYTAENQNIPNYNLYGRISVPLPVEWGQKYVEAIRTDSIDKNKDEFIKAFPGLYLKSTFGSGCMLFVGNSTTDAYTQIRIHYRTKEPGSSSDGGDSIRSRYAYWAVTKEVIQINAYKNTHIDDLLQDDDTIAYIKSPAGVFTELTIPIPEIIENIGRRQFSSVKLSLDADPQNDWAYSLGLPGVGEYASTAGVVSRLLLIPPDSTKNFFERQSAANNITSYTTKLTTSTYTYDFNNISNLIRYAIDHNPDEDLRLWLIPVQVSYTYSSQTGYVDYATAYDLYPAGVALHRNNRKITIIASDLKNNE